jgi:hypothetical protein
VRAGTSHVADRLDLLSLAANAIVLLVGLLVLVGWIFDVPALQAVVPGLATMKPNTAVAFFLAGMALWLFQDEQIRRWKRRLALGCSITVAMIGFLTLMEYLWRWDLGIDQLLFRDVSRDTDGAAPGRMSFSTALSFYLVGLALMLVKAGNGRNRLFVQFLILATFAVSLLALVGYAYGVESLYRVAPYGSMALHTVLTFLVLCLGILCACPRCWLTAALFQSDAGGVGARLWMTASIGIPFLIGWLGLAGLRAGFYDTVFGVALVTVGTMLILAVAVLWSGRRQ